MRSRKTAKRKTAFVPRIVFATAVAGAAVVPICACGGKTTGSVRSGSPDSGIAFAVAAIGFDSGIVDSGVGIVDTGVGIDVAARGFDSGFFGVADVSFSDAVAVNGFGDAVADAAFGVATDAFAPMDARVQDSGFPTVAMVGFDGSSPDTGQEFGVAMKAFDGSAGNG